MPERRFTQRKKKQAVGACVNKEDGPEEEDVVGFLAHDIATHMDRRRRRRVGVFCFLLLAVVWRVAAVTLDFSDCPFSDKKDLCAGERFLFKKKRISTLA